MSPRQVPGIARLRSDTPRCGSASNPEDSCAAGTAKQKIGQAQPVRFLLAEKEGFEPSRPVKAYMISNHAPSTN